MAAGKWSGRGYSGEGKKKVVKMIHKKIKSKQPDAVYGEMGSVLKEGDEKCVSYYFDSLEEFYRYLYVVDTASSKMKRTRTRICKGRRNGRKSMSSM